MKELDRIEGREATETGGAAGSPPRWRALCGWSAVGLALVIQYGLFREFALREVAWAYPSAHDQTQYLLDSYDIYERILDKGLLPGLAYAMGKPIPQGILLHVQASLIYLVMGPGRLSALTLNFLYFALFQGVLAWTLLWMTRRWSMVGIGLGLLLSCMTPFYWAGGLMDFRIDFSAMCLFGILLCLALRSGLFASRRWSAVVGVAAVYLILFRILTVVYLAAIIALFVGFLLVRLCWMWRDVRFRLIEWHRLVNLALAGAIVAGLTVPVLWHHRHILKSYYVTSHGASEESRIRVLVNGHSMSYYPRMLVQDQAGPLFVKLAVLVVVAAAIVGWVRRGSASQLGGENGASRRGLFWSTLAIALAVLPALWLVNATKTSGRELWIVGGVLIGGAISLNLARKLFAARSSAIGSLPAGPVFAFLTLSLVVPMAILTVDLHRSAVVVSVVIPALLWLVLGLVAFLAGLARGGARRPAIERGLYALAAVALVSGGWLQASQYSLHWKMTRHRDDNDEVLRLHDAIGKTCQECDIRNPLVALTTNVDYLPGRITSVLAYERLGVLLNIESILGGMFDVSEAEAIRALERCNFAIITHSEAVTTPFERAMVKLTPRLHEYCEQGMVRLGTYRIFGDDVVLYARKMWTEGDSGGWITSAGFNIKLPGRVLLGSKLVLSGNKLLVWGDEVPVVQAMLSIPGQSPRTLPVKLVVVGSVYALTIDCSDVDAPTDEIAHIRLTFDRYFVPKEKGMNEDTRQLVIPTPAEIVLKPRS